MSALIVDFPRRSLPLEAPPPLAAVSLSSSDECDMDTATTPPAPLRVSFASTFDIHFVENLSYKHKAELYFTDAEVRSFKYQTADMLRALRQHGLTMTQYAEMNVRETAAFMGLESYLFENSSREIKVRRALVRRAVLREQARQWDAAVYDSDAMANVNEAASGWALMRVQLIALLHAEER